VVRKAKGKLEEAHDHLRKLRTQRDTLAKPNVQRRLAAVLEALEREVIDVVETNKTLKQSVRQIVMDPEGGTLTIQWGHAEAPSAPIPFQSRHVFSSITTY
jgi:hypothetical protein